MSMDMMFWYIITYVTIYKKEGIFIMKIPS